MNMRDFIKTSAIAGTYVIVGVPWVLATENQGPWFDRQMRWTQLIHVENDPGQFDPDFWLDYFNRIHAQGACLKEFK